MAYLSPIKPVTLSCVSHKSNPSQQQPIQIDVQAEYAEEHSHADKQQFVFIYHIRICNHGKQAARLLSRHWIITDGSGHVEEVQGEGVVGEQPHIAPGGEHQYSSYCVLKTPVGCMRGSYQMLADNGDTFEAPIATFSLAVPGALH